MIARQTKSQETSTMTSSGTITTPSVGPGQNHVGSQIGQDDVQLLNVEETSKSEGTQAGGTLQHSGHGISKASTGSRVRDFVSDKVRQLTPKSIFFVESNSIEYFFKF